jgi:hypothetical protein
LVISLSRIKITKANVRFGCQVRVAMIAQHLEYGQIPISLVSMVPVCIPGISKADVDSGPQLTVAMLSEK